MTQPLPDIFWSMYLYTSFFLLPVHLFYFMGRPQAVALHISHRLHKAVLVMTLGLPLAACLIVQVAGSGPSQAEIRIQGPAAFNPPAEIAARVEAINEKGSDAAAAPLRDFHQMALGVLYTVVNIATAFSVMGLLVFLARISLQAGYIRHIQRSCPDEFDLQGCRIYTSSRISLPFSCLGIPKKIFLPQGLAGENRRMIITHEINHFKSAHHGWSLLESLICHLFWFNPMSHVMRRKGILLREMECDDMSVRTADRYLYSRLMVETAQSGTLSGRLGLMVEQWMQKGGLRERLEHLLSQGKTKKHKRLSLVLCAALAVIMGTGVYITLMDDEALEQHVLEKVTHTYSALLADRPATPLERLPDHLIQVLVFNEDARFFQHAGVSTRAVLRALVNNLTGGPLQGASTLSQQLVKRLCLDNPEKRLSRKLKQVKAARIVERHFTKGQILEMYLNSVYFGQGAVGIEAASQTFFQHPAGKLGVAESAMLIQSLTRPRDYNYKADPGLALERTRKLLERMADQGLLDGDTAEKELAGLKA